MGNPDRQGFKNLPDQFLDHKVFLVQRLFSAFQFGDLIEVFYQIYHPVYITGSILQKSFADIRIVHCTIQQSVYITLDGKNGCFELMCQILEKLFAVSLVGFEQFYFCTSLCCPFFHIFPYLIDPFLRKYIFIIGFFPFRSFGLVNVFVDQFDLAVNE